MDSQAVFDVDLDSVRQRYLKERTENRKRVTIIRGCFERSVCDGVVERISALANKFERRHGSYSTNDLPAFRLEANDYITILDTVRSRVFPCLTSGSGLEVENLYCKDLFIVKYEFGQSEKKQNELELHQDGSLLSFNLLLFA